MGIVAGGSMDQKGGMSTTIPDVVCGVDLPTTHNPSFPPLCRYGGLFAFGTEVLAIKQMENERFPRPS